MDATIVVESYNVGEGQSSERLAAALDAACRAAERAAGGPHHVVLVDVVAGPVTEALVRARPQVAHRSFPEGTPYDVVKDAAAASATTEAVVYLDGDCLPERLPEEWLDAMLAALEETGAPGVAGVTSYDGSGPLSTALSVMDFGFLVDDTDGELGCYASNNVAFRQAVRGCETIAVDGLRCACYLHAQSLRRSGAPMRVVDVPAGRMRHEVPPVWGERWRRGRDAVVVGWLDPSLGEADRFAGSRPRALGRFYVSSLRQDARVLRRLHRERRRPTWVLVGGAALVPPLRLIDVLAAGSTLRRGRRRELAATVAA